MDKVGTKALRLAPCAPADANEGAEQRATPRFTLLIRAAKLVSDAGEFVCVIRDVSRSGVSVRLFHTPTACERVALHMPGGAIYDLQKVWQDDGEAGFAFGQPVDVAQLISESGDYPKRGLRLKLSFPVTLVTSGHRHRAVVENMSQQGARIACEGLLAIDQAVRLELPGVGPEKHEVRAKVRWRGEREYGVVFDDTFSLGSFALLAARLQAPELLQG